MKENKNNLTKTEVEAYHKAFLKLQKEKAEQARFATPVSGSLSTLYISLSVISHLSRTPLSIPKIGEKVFHFILSEFLIHPSAKDLCTFVITFK